MSSPDSCTKLSHRTHLGRDGQADADAGAGAKRATKVELELATTAAAQMAGIGDRSADDILDVDPFVRGDEAVGLNARQAHQILDDPKHPPRLVADRLAEARTQLVGEVASLGERLGI